MTKYKVGDKVKVRDDLKCYFVYGNYYVIDEMLPFCGKIVTISDVYSKGYHIEKSLYNWTDEMFEGLAYETFKLSDIEFGDIITLRNGERYVYANEYIYSEEKSVGYDECDLAESFTESLKCNNGDDDDYEYDIVKVERAGQVVYERSNDILEVSMEDVARKFGVDNIKIIKDKEN